MKTTIPVALIALSLLSGCSGGSSHPNRIASITLSPASASIAVGQSQQFSGTATTNSGQTVTGENTGATWSSSNTSVAAVGQDGRALAMDVGSTTITATVQTGGGAVSGSATLTVTPAALVSIAVTPSSPSVTAGATQQFTAIGTYTDNSHQAPASTTWTSSNTTVASIDNNGLATTLAAGTTTITATSNGISGSATLTVTAPTKALASIVVTPETANLGVGISQQYAAIGTYNDGSIADVTHLASWSSSAPAATVTSQGVVSTVSPGNTNITASVGSVQGSAPLIVNSSTDGLVLIDDLTDPRLISYTGPDGSTGTLYGTRDGSGNPAALTGIIATTPDGKQAQYQLDSQGRPQSIRLSDNSQFLYSWSSATAGVVTVIGSDGASTISAPIDLSQSSPASNSRVRSGLSYVQSQAPAHFTTSPAPGPTLNVHVTSCAGKVNENWASVVLNLPGGPIVMGPPGTAGYYTAQLPTGPTGNPALQAATQVTSGACNVSQIVTAGCAVISAAVVVAGDGVPLAVASSINAACQTIGLSDEVLSTICSAASKVTTFDSVISWFNKQLGVPIPVTVSLASLVPMPALAQPNLGGTYPEVDADFPCPIVDHVDVVPGSATIAQGQKQELNATARDANDKILFSSAFNFSWSPDGTGTDIGSYPEFQGDNPFGTDSITGISAGGPDTVTATETTSGKKGTSAITVTAPQPLSLTVTWTVSPTNSDSWTGKDTLTINKNGTWNYAGKLTANLNGCNVERTESASGSGSSVLGDPGDTDWYPTLPNPPAPFTFPIGAADGAAEFFLTVTYSSDNDCSGTDGTYFGDLAPPATIVATPAAGGYTLSADPGPYTYPAVYNDSSIAITASGFLSTN